MTCGTCFSILSEESLFQIWNIASRYKLGLYTFIRCRGLVNFQNRKLKFHVKIMIES